MDKNRFETLKEIVNLDPTVHPIQSLFSVDDLKWLIEQAEETDDQTKWADTYFKELQEAKKEIEQKEKKTISKVLAYVEKNHDAPEIEEYLWKMLDKGTEFEQEVTSHYGEWRYEMTFRQFLKESKEHLPESKVMFYIGLPFVWLRFYIYKFTGGKF